MDKIAELAENVMKEVSKAEIPLEWRVEYLKRAISLLSGKAAKIAELNLNYAETVEKGFDLIGKRLKEPRIQYAIAQAQKRFIEKHGELVRNMHESRIKPEMQKEIAERVKQIEHVKLAEKTRETEAIDYLFDLMVKIFENNKLMYEIMEKDILPLTEMAANYEKLMKEKKKELAEVKDTNKIVGKKKIDKTELIKLMHVYKDKEDYLNKAVSGKILQMEGYELPIAGYDAQRKEIIFLYEKETFRIKPAELEKTLPLVILHNKIRNIMPYGKKTLGEVLELEDSQIKELDGWSKASKKPRQYWITNHEEKTILDLKHAIREKERMTGEKLRKEAKKKLEPAKV
jgi:hypothetical protein